MRGQLTTQQRDEHVVSHGYQWLLQQQPRTLQKSLPSQPATDFSHHHQHHAKQPDA
jgi:hypothetical protein